MSIAIKVSGMLHPYRRYGRDMLLLPPGDINYQHTPMHYHMYTLVTCLVHYCVSVYSLGQPSPHQVWVSKDIDQWNVTLMWYGASPLGDAAALGKWHALLNPFKRQTKCTLLKLRIQGSDMSATLKLSQ